MNERQLESLANHLNQSRQEFVTSLTMISKVLAALNDNIKDFRSHLDETLERVEDHFDEEYLACVARVVEAQEKFVASAEAIHDVTLGLNDRIQDCDNIFKGHLEMTEAQTNQLKTILEMFNPFFAAFAETNANIEANTKKLDALSLKVEKYFGSEQGLEYDN